jgi:hypothetical protein
LCDAIEGPFYDGEQTFGWRRDDRRARTLTPAGVCADQGVMRPPAPCARVRGFLVLALAAAVPACAATPASALRWSKPRTLLAAASPDGLGAGLAQSPDGNIVEAFSATDHGGIRLYPWRGASSLGAPVPVPGSRPGVADILPPVVGVALGDEGTAAVAWVRQIEEGNEEHECLCALRAAIRPAQGTFAPAQTVSPLAREEIASVQTVIGAHGRVTLLWNVGSAERWSETSGTRFGKPQPMDDFDSALLSTVAGRPEIYFLPEGGEPNREQVFAGPLPLRSRRLLGQVPGETVEPDGETLAADPRGDLVVVGVEDDLKVAYRLAGRRLARPRRLARLGEDNLCEVNATMNARGEALLAWGCNSATSFTGPGQAVLLSRGGRVLATSRRRSVAGPPAIALDPNGNALVAWELPAGRGVLVATQQRNGRRFGPVRPVLRDRDVEAIHDLSLAIRGRRALALWKDSVPVPHRERWLERARIATTTLE